MAEWQVSSCHERILLLHHIQLKGQGKSAMTVNTARVRTQYVELT